jgi:hypothetical protein
MEIVSRKRLPSFFLVMAVVGLFAAIIGFGKTFFLPVAGGSFRAPFVIHLHGAFAFAWILLFLIQPALIHFGRYRIHQYLGILGLLIAAGISVTMIPAGLFVVRRELDQGLGDFAYSSLLGVITSGILFFALVFAGIVNRKKPETHKRLMLLATIVVLWPAWFRFRHYFPSVPRPEIWFGLILADSFIIIAWIWDKIKNGSVHPVLKYAGTFIIIEQSLEVALFGTPTYRVVAKWFYGILN